MNKTKYNLINFTQLNRRRGQLAQPILTAEFVAGLDSETLHWRVIPLAHIAQLEFSHQPNFPGIQFRNETLKHHMQRLAGQLLRCELSLGTKLTAELIEVEDSLLWLKKDSGVLAIPIQACTSIWLWKNQMSFSAAVSAFE